MLVLISCVVFVLGVLQGVTGKECPPFESLQCLSVSLRCISVVQANITLTDNTTCPGCYVCTHMSFLGTFHTPPRGFPFPPPPMPPVEVLFPSRHRPREVEPFPPPPPRPRVAGQQEDDSLCPVRACPMWRIPQGCKEETFSQWIEIDGEICSTCNTWRCINYQ